MGMITASAKWEKKITFLETHKLWFDSNHLPVIPAEEQAVWNRVTVIVFDNPVPKENQDKKLKETILKEEAEGIVAWAVRGELLRKEHGLGAAPEKFQQQKNQWMKRMDTIAQFVEECCEVGPKPRGRSNELYKVYVAWVGEERAISHKAFTQGLRKLGYGLNPGRYDYCGLRAIPVPTEEELFTD
jgi:putative DNA primase/helicase